MLVRQTSPASGILLRLIKIDHPNRRPAGSKLPVGPFFYPSLNGVNRLDIEESDYNDGMTKINPNPKSKATIGLTPLEAEALRVAKKIQVEGQTKEETKRIAKGIAKGIELYKRQESAKGRERDKQRKRDMKVQASRSESTGVLEADHSPSSRWLKSQMASVIGWCLIALMGVGLTILDTPLQWNGSPLPKTIFITVSLLATLLALWQTKSLMDTHIR
jgi:hypothetical protein